MSLTRAIALIEADLVEACELLRHLHADLEAIHRSQDLQPPPHELELRNLEAARAFLAKMENGNG